MKLETIAWHAGVALTVLTLGYAFATGSWQMTLTAAAATFLLRKTSARVPLPRIYRDLGITESYLMGEDRAPRA